MKKKILSAILVGFLCCHTKTHSMNWLDFFATWFVASYAYHGWRHWMEHRENEQRPFEEVLDDLRCCLRSLQEKVKEEKKDIEQCKQEIKELKNKYNASLLLPSKNKSASGNSVIAILC